MKNAGITEFESEQLGKQLKEICNDFQRRCRCSISFYAEKEEFPLQNPIYMNFKVRVKISSKHATD